MKRTIARHRAGRDDVTRGSSTLEHQTTSSSSSGQVTWTQERGVWVNKNKHHSISHRTSIQQNATC